MKRTVAALLCVMLIGVVAGCGTVYEPESETGEEPEEESVKEITMLENTSPSDFKLHTTLFREV